MRVISTVTNETLSLRQAIDQKKRKNVQQSTAIAD